MTHQVQFLNEAYASFACTVLNSPPYVKQYVSVTRFHANAMVTSDSKQRNIKKFIVEADNVVFGSAGSTAVLTLTNDLDSESVYW